MFMGSRAVAEAAAAVVVGAENFTMKSKGKKKLKKAKFKSLAEGSLMSDTDDASLGEDYTLEGSNDPTYRDLHSDMLPLPHRSPSQRKRKAPKLLDEEMLVEMHTKKFKKDVSNKIKGFSAEKVVHNFFLEFFVNEAFKEVIRDQRFSALRKYVRLYYLQAGR